MLETKKLYTYTQYVFVGVQVNGACIVEEFMNKLSVEDRGKLLALFKRFGDEGRISNREKFQKLQDDIWEFKSYQIRVLCFFGENKTMILTHGFIKKKDKTPKSEIARAVKFRSQYFKGRAQK
jgi:phage-related protein